MKHWLYFVVTITLANDNFSAVQLIDNPCYAAFLVLVVYGTYVIIADDIDVCLNWFAVYKT